MIEQTFTPETFTEFAYAQVRKAADESEPMARIRVLALQQSIDIAKASFEQGAVATVPVIEAAKTEQTIAPKDALGSDRGGAIANPEDLGTDLTKALDKLTKALEGPAADESKAAAGKDKAPVQKGMGPRDSKFEDLDNMQWPENMAAGKVDAEWGDD